MFFALLQATNSAIQWLELSKTSPIVFEESELDGNIGFVLFQKEVDYINGTIKKILLKPMQGSGGYALSVKGGSAIIGNNNSDNSYKYVKFTAKEVLCPAGQAILYTAGTTTKASIKSGLMQCYVGIGANKMNVKISSGEYAMLTQKGITTTISESKTIDVDADIPYLLTIVAKNGSLTGSFDTSGTIYSNDVSACITQPVMQYSFMNPYGSWYFFGQRTTFGCTLTSAPSNLSKIAVIIIIAVVVVAIVVFGAIAAVVMIRKRNKSNENSTITKPIIV